jgi:hypothetical protein
MTVNQRPVVLGSDGLHSTGRQVSRLLDDLAVPTRGSVAVLASNVPAFMEAYRGATSSSHARRRSCCRQGGAWSSADP